MAEDKTRGVRYPADMTPSARLPLSGFVITKNEGARIEACLRSLADCAEIVVVDSGSTDDTRAVVERLAAEGLPIRWIENRWPGFAAQKQFALEQCRQPWAVNLDADERLDSAIRAELPRLLDAPQSVAGWRIKRCDYLLGHGYPSRSAGERPKLRLVRTGRAAYDLSQMVHEGLIPDGETPAAPRGAMLHFRILPLAEQMLKENAYSSLKAEQRGRAGKRKSPWRMVFSPLGYFLRLWLTRGYWRCGWAGFILSMNAAIYAFLTEAKTWENAAVAARPPVDLVD